MPEDLPEELAALVADLEAVGFELVANVHDEANFGNRLFSLENPSRDTAREIRLVRDRGLWSAEVKVGAKWRDPYEVLLALDQARYARRASNHEERRQFTLEVLNRIPESASDLPAVLDRLEAFDREYWSRFEAKLPGDS